MNITNNYTSEKYLVSPTTLRWINEGELKYTSTYKCVQIFCKDILQYKPYFEIIFLNKDDELYFNLMDLK